MLPTKPAFALNAATPSVARKLSADSPTIIRKAKGGGLAQAIRVGLRFKMDELQRDLMEERWDLLVPYPNQLRSYVYIFTTYTDAAFPSDSTSDKDLRVTLRYEVGRYYGSLGRLKKAIDKQALDEAFIAYADMSLHFDKYLHAGGLYTYYDVDVNNNDVINFEINNISNNNNNNNNKKVAPADNVLVYSDPNKDPAEVRDLVVLTRGPDKGKCGILIGIYPPTEKAENTCVVKLDEYRGMREILVVPKSWAAKRLGEQAPDAVFSIPRKGEIKV